jgi:hypothetical protein
MTRICSPVRTVATAVIEGALVAVVAVAVASSAGAADAPAGVEFKFSLKPKVASSYNRKLLWALIGADPKNADKKNCRLIAFLDAPGAPAENAGFLIRFRAKLDGNDCPDKVSGDERGEVTLKFRDADQARAAREDGQAWAQAGDHKFEEDVSAGAEGHALTVHRAYGVSATIEDAKAPGSIKALRAQFAGALPSLPPGASLTAGCRRALEERWVWKSEAADLPDEVELAVWYRVARDGTRAADPMLAELSFKAGLDDAVSLRRADALAARLTRTIDADWLSADVSKTSAVFKCHE